MDTLEKTRDNDFQYDGVDPNRKANTPTWPGDGKPGNPDPAAFKSPHDNPNAVDHAVLHPNEDRREGGKDMGLVKPPIVSMHPTSAKQGEADAKIGDHTIIDKANFKLNHYLPEAGHYQFAYPFEDLVPGQGMFIPVEENKTTDNLMNKLYHQIDQYRKQASEVERDENGDDVMEDVAINQKKRNEDGTVQLDGSVPRLGIKSGFRPKLIGPTFVVKAVVKGDTLAENNEADGDGALVIRMS